VPLFLGLDFGGTKLAAGLATADGQLVTFARRPTVPEVGGIGAVQAMRELVDEMGERARKIAAIGISFGGPVARDRQTTLLSHHGPGWIDYPLVEVVGQIWPVRIELDNDANAAALGEYRFGAGRDYQNVLYLTVSTGVGGGIVLGGRLYRGTRGLAGEVGHTIVWPDGPRCSCGKQGCVEAIASGPSIARAYVERQPSALAEVTAEEVFRLAVSGDVIAREVLDRAITFLGTGVANAINVLDPDVVVIGGGVSRAGAALFVPLRQAIAAASAPSPPNAVAIVPASLGDGVGVLGAVALVL